MRCFRRTYFLHGYAGSRDGSILKLFNSLVTILGPDRFGEIHFPDLPFSKRHASFDDTPAQRSRFLEAALALPWELEGALMVGLSMGGLLAALLAQRQGEGKVAAFSAPDHLDSNLTLNPSLPIDLLAVFSSKDDPVIHGRTGLWGSLTPYAFDIDGVNHDHDAQIGIYVLLLTSFVLGRGLDQIQSILAELNDPLFPAHIY